MSEEYHPMSRHDKLKWFLIANVIMFGGFFTALAGAVSRDSLNHKNARIPQQKQVQSGYVVPSKLEIDVQDLDHDGQMQTIIRYGEDGEKKEYLFMIDNKGKPTIREYTVKPAEVVVGQE